MKKGGEAMGQKKVRIVVSGTPVRKKSTARKRRSRKKK